MLPDNRVEVALKTGDDVGGEAAPPVDRRQDRNQGGPAPPAGDVDRPFAVAGAERPPGAQFNEPVRDPHGGAAMGRLVEGRVARAAAGAARVHALGAVAEDAEHLRPVIAARGVGQRVPHPETPVGSARALVDAVDPVPSRLFHVPPRRSGSRAPAGAAILSILRTRVSEPVSVGLDRPTRAQRGDRRTHGNERPAQRGSRSPQRPRCSPRCIRAAMRPA